MTDSSGGLDDAALEARLRGLGAGARSGAWVPSGGRLRPAQVLVDSASGSLEAVRSGTDVSHRQIVVQSGPLVVVLDIVPGLGGSGTLVASGQVVGAESVAVVQVTTPEGREVALTTIDEVGEFTVEVPPGDYELVVATATDDVVMPVTLA